MKRIFLPLVCTAACWASGLASAGAETPLELLEQAQKDLQVQVDAARKVETTKAEEAAKTDKTDETDKSTRELELAARLEMLRSERLRGDPLESVVRILGQVHNALVADREGEALQNLQQLSSLDLNVPEDVRKDVDALTRALGKAHADREEAYAKEVDAACQRAGEVLLKATAPKDLDAIQRELGQLAAKISTRDYYNNGGEGRYGNKLQGAVQFINHWQDYLLARSRDNEEGVTQALRNLSEGGGYNQVSLVPRSEVLARMPAKDKSGGSSDPSHHPVRTPGQIDADADAIVQKIKKLDDLPDALGKLAVLRQETASQVNYGYRPDTDLSYALTTLQGLERTKLELQNGLATNLNLGNRSADSTVHPEIENILLSLRVELVREAAPRLLGASADARPAPDEPLDAYIRRLIELAKGRQDWAAVVRGLDLKRTLATTATSFYNTNEQQENEAFKNFFAGKNLEGAGQYEQAVSAYLTALRSGQQDLPAAVIGEHLMAIEKAHPTEYASGKELVLNPPRPSYGDPRFPYPAGPMQRGGYDPRFPGGRPPGFPGQPGADEKLAVPATSPTPTPMPTPAVTPAPTKPAASERPPPAEQAK